MAEAVVPVASKNTDNGATPLIRLGTFDNVIAAVAPEVEHAPPVFTVTVALLEALPPAPVHEIV